MFKQKTLPHFDTSKLVYGPYSSRKDKRLCVCIIDSIKKTRNQQLFSRYIVEQHIGRELLENETVDHIDRNKFNDDISNLRIVSKADHAACDAKRVEKIKTKCPMCCTIFLSSPHNMRRANIKQISGPFCSKSCSGKYGAFLQNKKIDKLPNQEYVKSSYFFEEKNIIENEKLLPNLKFI